MKSHFKMEIKFILIFLFTSFSAVQGGMPGTFFWRPRLGIDLSIPTTEITQTAHKPSKQSVADGFVVAIDGYQAGLTIIALAAGISSAKPYPVFNPLSAYFYTHSYRWGLRHLSLIPVWIGGRGHYCDTLKVWRRRFFYVDEFIPKWLRYLFPYVKNEEWEKEEKEFKLFKKYSESAFGKHYKYPTKVFNDFLSQETTETLEDSDIKSSSGLD